MAAKGWDDESNTFIIDKNAVFNTATNRWMESEPTDFEIFEKFSRMLSATQDKKSLLVYISFEHYSPIFAKEVVELLLSEINQQTSQRRLKLTEKYISSHKLKIVEENSQIIIDNISRLILEQQRLQMLAELSDSYLFNVLEYPLVEKKSGKRRSIIVIASTLLGIFIDNPNISEKISLRLIIISNESTILVTGGTGSFGHEFIKMTLAKYNPKERLLFSQEMKLKQMEMAKLFQMKIEYVFYR